MISFLEKVQGTACKEHPDLWFPEKGSAQIQARTAKKMCNGEHPKYNAPCPFREECLEAALDRNERHGVWGGMSEPDRQRERRRRKEEAQAQLAKVIPIQSKQEASMPSVSERAAKLAAKKKEPSSNRKATGTLARWAEAKKVHGRVLPEVQKMLLTRPQDEHRSHDLIHVSTLAKNDWCPRASWLRIIAARSGEFVVAEAPRFQLDNIFEEGDRIHAKWQSWFWDMGILFGRFKCEVCERTWDDTSPAECTYCGAVRSCLTYCEVVMNDPEHLLTAHADGELRFPSEEGVLIEIKSVGAGTIRTEAPKALAKYTHKYVDEDGVARTHFDHETFWRDLRRPMPSHLRQGYLYLFLRALYTREHGWPPVKRIVFIYEYKPTQAVKEFEIVIDEDWVDEALADCKDVVYALDSGIAPTCKAGRSRRCAACATLIELEKKVVDGIEPRKAQARRGNDSRAGARRKQGPADAPATRTRTRIARRPDRPGRQRTDEPADAPHSLGRLLGRSTGDGLRRRTGS